MPPKPPSFGSQHYWDQRFAANSDPFEWLESPTVLDSHLIEALASTSTASPQLLHIGCGTSLLPYHLRSHVENPEQIHNIDYSTVAIDIGKQREADIFDHKDASRETTSTDVAVNTNKAESRIQLSHQNVRPRHMRWSAMDLLDHSSLLEACRPSSYSIIVDKSTVDSIACSDDVYVPLPYHIRTRNSKAPSELTESSEPIHPVHIMAIHLALVTKPKARWISLSYSEDRFPFIHMPAPFLKSRYSVNESASTSTAISQVQPHSEFKQQALGDDCSFMDDLDDIPQQVIDNGLPDPNTLWNLKGKYEIEAPQQVPNAGGQDSATHRPRVLHWIYILERTDVEVCVDKK